MPLENWVWAVLYNDGKMLCQFDDSGAFHRISEIDQSRVKQWTLYQPAHIGTGRIHFVLPQGKNVKLIHKYKNFIFCAGTPQERRMKVYCIGYKIGEMPAVYTYVTKQGKFYQSFGEELELSNYIQ